MTLFLQNKRESLALFLSGSMERSEIRELKLICRSLSLAAGYTCLHLDATPEDDTVMDRDASFIASLSGD